MAVKKKTYPTAPAPPPDRLYVRTYVGVDYAVRQQGEAAWCWTLGEGRAAADWSPPSRTRAEAEVAAEAAIQARY